MFGVHWPRIQRESRPSSNCRQPCHHSGWNGELADKGQTYSRFAATAFMWGGTHNIYVGLRCSSSGGGGGSCSGNRRGGLTVIIFRFCSPTGPRHTIRSGVLVGRSVRGGGPFVGELSEDGAVKLVTLWRISSCRLLAPLPFLSSPWPSRLQAPVFRQRNAHAVTSGTRFQNNSTVSWWRIDS